MNPVHSQPPSYDEYTTGVTQPSLLEVEDGLTENQRRGNRSYGGGLGFLKGIECFAEKLKAHLFALWLLWFITFIIACCAMGKANKNAEKIKNDSDSVSMPESHYDHWIYRCSHIKNALYGDDVVEFNGHHYQFIGGSWAKMTWHDAEGDAWSRCWNGKPGYLISIESEEENNFIFETLRNTHGFEQGDRAWLGGTDMMNEGVFQWIDGYASGNVFYRPGGGAEHYNNFADNEPNENGSEDCVSFSGDVGDWNDDNCYRQLPFFIVEFDA